jgi:excisionase family DNA binding protein
MCAHSKKERCLNIAHEDLAACGVVDLRASAPPDSTQHNQTNQKLLFSREEAAAALSISIRSLDYLIANKELSARRIGTRVLIQAADLRKFARGDHKSRPN